MWGFLQSNFNDMILICSMFRFEHEQSGGNNSRIVI